MMMLAGNNQNHTGQSIPNLAIGPFDEIEAIVPLRPYSKSLETDLIAFPELPMCRRLKPGEQPLSGDAMVVGGQHCLCWMPNGSGSFALASQRLSTVSYSSSSSEDGVVVGSGNVSSSTKPKSTRQQLFDLRGRKKSKRDQHRRSDPLVVYNNGQTANHVYNPSSYLQQLSCPSSSGFLLNGLPGIGAGGRTSLLDLSSSCHQPSAPSLPLTEPISGQLIAALKRKIQTEGIDLTSTPYTDQVGLKCSFFCSHFHISNLFQMFFFQFSVRVLWHLPCTSSTLCRWTGTRFGRLCQSIGRNTDGRTVFERPTRCTLIGFLVSLIDWLIASISFFYHFLSLLRFPTIFWPILVTLRWRSSSIMTVSMLGCIRSASPSTNPNLTLAEFINWPRSLR